MLSMKLNSNAGAPARAKSNKNRGERGKKTMAKYANRFFRQFGCVCVSVSVTLNKYKKEKKWHELIFLDNSNVRACVRYIKKYKREKKGDDKVCSAQNGKSPKI